jgi:hypothetical protein
MSLEPYGSLEVFMTEYEKLLQTIADACGDDMVVRRWKPLNLVDAPMVYNWLPDAPFEQRDLQRWRDTLQLLTRISIPGSDVETKTARFERYADKFREIADPLFDQNQPLNGSCYRIKRTGMSTVADTFNEISVFAIQFRVEVWLDRHIHGN